MHQRGASCHVPPAPPPLPDLNNHQVWTFHNRVALVVAVTEAGSPLADQAKLSTLSTTLYEMLGRAMPWWHMRW